MRSPRPGGPYDPYRARKRPRRESPLGSIRRHQVQFKGRALWKGRRECAG